MALRLVSRINGTLYNLSQEQNGMDLRISVLSLCEALSESNKADPIANILLASNNGRPNVDVHQVLADAAEKLPCQWNEAVTVLRPTVLGLAAQCEKILQVHLALQGMLLADRNQPTGVRPLTRLLPNPS